MICDSDTANQILESHVFFSLSRVCLLPIHIHAQPIPFLPSYTNTNTIPSIFCHLSRFRSPGSEAQTSITLALQLIWADNELFSSQPRHIICPASPGSVWVHPPSRTRPEYFTQEVGGGLLVRCLNHVNWLLSLWLAALLSAELLSLSLKERKLTSATCICKFVVLVTRLSSWAQVRAGRKIAVNQQLCF